VRSCPFVTSDGMGGTAWSENGNGMGGVVPSGDGNGMGGMVPSGDENGRVIVVTGSVLGAAGSGMVSSFRRRARAPYRYRPPLSQRQAGTPRWGIKPERRDGGLGSMRARTLADAEQGGRHRIDSVLAAWIRYRRYAAWRAS